MLYITIIILIYLLRVASTTWHESSSKLPRPDSNLAVGFYNKSIYLLGGEQKRQQFIEYDISADSFTDHGKKWVDIDIFSYGSYYIQMHDILYIKTNGNKAISTFDLKTSTFGASYTSNINNDDITNPCVAATDDYIFVTGGRYLDSSSSSVHIYDLFTSQWMQNVPVMIKQREEHSCAIHPTTNELYVFGGYAYVDVFFSDIEKINTNNITQNTWTFVDDLTVEICSTRAVVYGNIIFIIGGYGEDVNTVNIIHTLDVLTDAISVFVDPLPMALCEVAPIIIDHILYVFGGWPDGNQVDGLWTYDLKKLNISGITTTQSAIPITTTRSITLNPTESTMTNLPTTTAPSNQPSDFPSSQPIASLSTDSPSLDPIENPSEPTMAPSNQRTAAPSGAPTFETNTNTPTGSLLSSTNIPFIWSTDEETTQSMSSVEDSVNTTTSLMSIVSTPSLLPTVNDKEWRLEIDTVLIVILSVIALVSFALCFVGFRFYKLYKSRERGQKQMEMVSDLSNDDIVNIGKQAAVVALEKYHEGGGVMEAEKITSEGPSSQEFEIRIDLEIECDGALESKMTSGANDTIGNDLEVIPDGDFIVESDESDNANGEVIDGAYTIEGSH